MRNGGKDRFASLFSIKPRIFAPVLSKSAIYKDRKIGIIVLYI